MKFKPSKFFVFSTLVFCTLLVLIYGRYIETNSIEIQEINLIGGSESSLKGLTVLHLSDLHIPEFGKNEIQVLNLIKQVDPDLIFLTGDYVEWNRSYKGALQFLSKLEARHGVYAVMGDYDYSSSRNSCLFCHEKGTGETSKLHKVIMLRDSMQKISFGGQEICVAGIDGADEDFEKLEQIINGKGDSQPLLILSHSPFAFDRFPDDKPLFMFAGDTHGGQIKLPKWLYEVFGYQKNVKYNHGLFQSGEKKMYVTSGIGTSHFRFRLFCRPEIAVIRF